MADWSGSGSSEPLGSGGVMSPGGERGRRGALAYPQDSLGCRGT